MRAYYLQSATGERVPLRKPETTVGRDPSCDIVVNDSSISRQHVRLLVKDGALSVEDNGSRNGTFVDGVQLAAKATQALAEGMTLRLGTVDFAVHSEEKSAAAPEPMRATAEFSVEHFIPQARAKTGEALESNLAEVLYRAQGALFPAQPIDALLDSLLHLAAAYVPASVLSVSLISPITSELETRATVGQSSAKGPALISRGVAEKVMQQRKAVLIRDRLQDKEFSERQSLVQAGITSAAATPIFDGNDILGVLSAYIVEGKRELTEADVGVLTVLASLAGTALVAANMMSDLMRAQAELAADNERLQRELAALRGHKDA